MATPEGERTTATEAQQPPSVPGVVIPTEFDISSLEVNKIHENMSFNIGSEKEVLDAIFNRSSSSLTSTITVPNVDTIERGEGEEGEGTIQSPPPAHSEWWTYRLDQPVRIRYGTTAPQSEDAETVLEMFERVVAGYGEHKALGVKRAGEWRTWTYNKYYQECVVAAKAFIELGLQPHHSVCILGFNAPEWHISSLAAIMACGVQVGMYLTSSTEACYTIAHDSQANIIVVENDSQLQKILQVRDRLPELKAIVQYSKEVTEAEGNIVDWKRFMQLGQRTPDTKLKERMARLAHNKCCSLIYTSGTSGKPKGVMLSHDNLTWMCRRVMHETHCTRGEEHVISYLPLSHVATQLLDIYTTMAAAGTCWFAQHDALKGSLLQTMKEVHPTIFLGVPRVWEKVAESMQMVARSTTGLKAKIASWAQGVGLKANITKQTGGSGTPLGWTVANWVFFKKVRLALGLDRCHMPMTGSAPISQNTLTYFMGVNIPLYEIYGMSECTGPTTVTSVDKIRFMSSGRAFEGAKLKIDSPDERGDGELLVHGRHVFMGYLGVPHKTVEVLDEDGWLRSGDVGHIDEEGFLYITGRKKEIIVTVSGEKVAPVPIENAIKHELPIISNAIVIGEQQKFLACLLTLRVEMNEMTGLPTDKLTPVAVEACQKVGSLALTVGGILDNGGDQRVLKMIQRGIDTINRRALSRSQKIAKWSILEKDFCIASGELTPTLKLKRRDIMANYVDCIESFYS